MEAQSEQPGTVYTFYSYKGGVGRSMAMANVAAWLAKWGQRVLMVDWDLEAPGIETYFANWVSRSEARTGGVIDLIESNERETLADWRKFLMRVKPPGCREMHVLPAGKDLDLPAGDGEYTKRLRSIDWDMQFAKKRLGNYLEKLREEWRHEYDFVLIDSRTGITDIGGICTIHLPDVLITFFTSNEQSLLGVRDVMERARRGHQRLPVDRLTLLVVPVPSRDESGSEYELAKEWRGKFGDALGDFFKDWMPKDEDPTTVLDFLKIPYFAYWSFGERVPVLEEPDPENPKTLSYAYQPLARLVLTRLDWAQAREGTRSTELARQHEAEAEKARLETRRLQASEEQRLATMQKADEYLNTRTKVQIHWLRARATRYGTLVRIVTAGAVLATLTAGTASLLAYYKSLRPESLSPLSGDQLVFMAFGSIIFGMFCGLYWRMTRPHVRAKIARAGAMELERLTSTFRAGFPGEDPQRKLEKFVDMVEAEIAGTQWALDDPHAAQEKEA